MQTISFLVFLAVPIFAALIIDTEAFVPFLILFFAIAGLSASHPSYDGAEQVTQDQPPQASTREFRSATGDRPAGSACVRS